MDNNVSDEFAESIFRVLEEKYAAHQKKNSGIIRLKSRTAVGAAGQWD